jgi:hypothetical protein
MTKRINVNPDHYKVAGRERPGDAILKPPNQSKTMNEEELKRWERTRKKKEEGRRKG